MFRASLCPSSGEQDWVLPHMVFCTGCAGCDCVDLAVVHSLVLLMMGIMMPETCWDRSWIINSRLVASCRFLSLHPTFTKHGHKSLNKSVYTVALPHLPCDPCITIFYVILFHRRFKNSVISVCVGYTDSNTALRISNRRQCVIP